MIFSTTKAEYEKAKPHFGQHYEYKDQNELTWEISVAANGLFLAYTGSTYFKEDYHTFEANGQEYNLINTGFYFFNVESESEKYESFEQIRSIVKSQFTDSIFEEISGLICERVKASGEILACELAPNSKLI